MRILFLSRAYSENAGGMERLSFELINECRKKTDIEVDAIVHTGSRVKAPLFVFTCIPILLRKAGGADIVHLGDPLLSLPGFLVKHLLRKKVTITIHGLDVSYSHPLYRLYLWLFFRNFDLYLPISEHAKDLLGRWNVSGAVSLFTPGFTDQYYNPSANRNDLARILNRPVDNKVVLFTSGRLVKRKGHAWFIKHVLPGLSGNVLYVIAGAGPEEQNIRRTIKEAKTQDRVMLLGKVSHEILLTLYNTVDAFIQPNISIPNDAEGFGLVLIEAASCQLPVFAANIEGIPSAIQDQKNGILLPSQNASAWMRSLNHFIQKQARYKEKAQKARKYTLQKYNWSEQTQNFITSLLNLVN